MGPHERIQFIREVRAEVVSGMARRAGLEALRRLDHLRSNREVIQSGAPDDVLRVLSHEPQGTFEEWFWARCRRLGIEGEFRAKFEEWMRSE
jgi:hypothetical protein